MKVVNHVYSTWVDNYYNDVQLVLGSGMPRESREGETIDLGPTTLFYKVGVQPFRVAEGRGGKREFAELEQLCYLAGSDPDVLEQVAPSFSRFKDPVHNRYYGSYGPRLKEQLQHVVTELRRHPDSRRAVVALWEKEDLWRTMLDPPSVPCTTSLTFWRDEVDHSRVHLHACMRSCDVWWGLYYDLPAFSMLLEAVCWGLGGGDTEVKPGHIWLTCTSLHLYKAKASKAEFKITRVGVGEPLRLSVGWPIPEGGRRMHELFKWAWLRLEALSAELLPH